MTRLVHVAMVVALAAIAPPASLANTAPEDMVLIPSGTYQPLYRGTARDSADGKAAPERLAVAAFLMDRRPVTNAQFLEFVRAHPKWRRSQIKAVFADAGYLKHWAGDLDLGENAPAASPVVNVSWFVARAYAAAHGKRLPTVDEWEMAGAASEVVRDATDDEAFQDRLRNWYAQPTPARLAAVGSTFRNLYGVDDLHGLIWEWTRDFNSALITGESRGDVAVDRALYCGSGAAGAADFRNYAAFMRFAFRSSLEARYTVANLGFRCARDAGAGVELP